MMRRMKPAALPALVLPLLVACHSQEPGSAAKTEAAPAYQPDPLTDPRETHLQDIVQLTFAGENAEGYFDSTGTKLVFQAREGDRHDVRAGNRVGHITTRGQSL